MDTNDKSEGKAPRRKHRPIPAPDHTLGADKSGNPDHTLRAATPEEVADEKPRKSAAEQPDPTADEPLDYGSYRSIPDDMEPATTPTPGRPAWYVWTLIVLLACGVLWWLFGGSSDDLTEGEEQQILAETMASQVTPDSTQIMQATQITPAPAPTATQAAAPAPAPAKTAVTAKNAPQTASVQSMSVETLAKMVLKGKFGNGAKRKALLGAKYAAVQAMVNRILSK